MLCAGSDADEINSHRNEGHLYSRERDCGRLLSGSFTVNESKVYSNLLVSALSSVRELVFSPSLTGKTVVRSLYDKVTRKVGNRS
jgi:hypothetical protein